MSLTDSQLVEEVLNGPVDPEVKKRLRQAAKAKRLMRRGDEVFSALALILRIQTCIVNHSKLVIFRRINRALEFPALVMYIAFVRP